MLTARPRKALLGALGGVAVFVLVRIVAFDLPAGRRLDAMTLQAFLDQRRLQRPSDVVVRLADAAPFLALSTPIVVIAVGRRRRRVAFEVAFLLAGANLSSQLLQRALPRRRTVDWIPETAYISATSWPSGHATASMSLAVAAVLVTPARWRPIVAPLGALYVVSVCSALLTLGWHFPSDVLAGWALAGTWALVVLAALDARPASRGSAHRARSRRRTGCHRCRARLRLAR